MENVGNYFYANSHHNYELANINGSLIWKEQSNCNPNATNIFNNDNIEYQDYIKDTCVFIAKLPVYSPTTQSGKPRAKYICCLKDGSSLFVANHCPNLYRMFSRLEEKNKSNVITLDCISKCKYYLITPTLEHYKNIIIKHHTKASDSTKNSNWKIRSCFGTNNSVVYDYSVNEAIQQDSVHKVRQTILLSKQLILEQLNNIDDSLSTPLKRLDVIEALQNTINPYQDAFLNRPEDFMMVKGILVSFLFRSIQWKWELPILNKSPVLSIDSIDIDYSSGGCSLGNKGTVLTQIQLIECIRNYSELYQEKMRMIFTKNDVMKILNTAPNPNPNKYSLILNKSYAQSASEPIKLFITVQSTDNKKDVCQAIWNALRLSIKLFDPDNNPDDNDDAMFTTYSGFALFICTGLILLNDNKKWRLNYVTYNQKTRMQKTNEVNKLLELVENTKAIQLLKLMSQLREEYAWICEKFIIGVGSNISAGPGQFCSVNFPVLQCESKEHLQAKINTESIIQTFPALGNNLPLMFTPRTINPSQSNLSNMDAIQTLTSEENSNLRKKLFRIQTYIPGIRYVSIDYNSPTKKPMTQMLAHDFEFCKDGFKYEHITEKLKLMQSCIAMVKTEVKKWSSTGLPGRIENHYKMDETDTWEDIVRFGIKCNVEIAKTRVVVANINEMMSPVIPHLCALYGMLRSLLKVQNLRDCSDFTESIMQEFNEQISQFFTGRTFRRSSAYKQISTHLCRPLLKPLLDWQIQALRGFCIINGKDLLLLFAEKLGLTCPRMLHSIPLISVNPYHTTKPKIKSDIKCCKKCLAYCPSKLDIEQFQKYHPCIRIAGEENILTRKPIVNIDTTVIQNAIRNILSTFNTDQMDVYKIITNSNPNLIILGAAGVGKSHMISIALLTLVKKHGSVEKVVYTSALKEAAQSGGGYSLHKLFHLYNFKKNELLDLNNANDNDIDNYYKVLTSQSPDLLKELTVLEVLFIDEAEMLGHLGVQFISRLLQKIKQKPNENFGGVRMIFIGDIGQCKPITKDKNKKFKFFFEACCVKYHNPPFLFVYMQKVLRQKNLEFIELSNKYRLGTITDNELESLNKMFGTGLNDAQKCYIKNQFLKVYPDALKYHPLLGGPNPKMFVTSSSTNQCDIALDPEQKPFFITTLKRQVQLYNMKDVAYEDKSYFTSIAEHMPSLDKSFETDEWDINKGITICTGICRKLTLRINDLIEITTNVSYYLPARKVCRVSSTSENVIYVIPQLNNQSLESPPIPVQKISKEFQLNSITYTRKGFPIIKAIATNVHKLIGRTINSPVAIDNSFCNDWKYAEHILYTAMSRNTDPGQVVLICPISKPGCVDETVKTLHGKLKDHLVTAYNGDNEWTTNNILLTSTLLCATEGSITEIICSKVNITEIILTIFITCL